MMTLHERIAEKLEWSLEDTESVSLYGLRELVRSQYPDLAEEVTLEINRTRKVVSRFKTKI